MRQSSIALTRVSSILILSLSSVFPFGQSLASVESLLTLPENKIDIGIVALTLDRESNPEIDVASYSARIDALADRVRRLSKGTTDPDQRIRCLNTVIFLYEKYHADRDLSSQRKPEKYSLAHLLDTKEGNCFSMPLLYVAVGQRLGWPLHLVHVPDHSFVRYVDSSFKEQNIEATSGGGYVSDEKYAEDFNVSRRGQMSGAYLRSLTYRELIGDIVATNAIAMGKRKQLSGAISYLKTATKLNPRLAGAWANLANAYKMKAKQTSGVEAEKYLSLAGECVKSQDELGFVH